MSKNNTPDFLKDALKFGINLGLQRMEALDEALGNPQDSFRAVHLAGTNGKGSTATYISSILAASGKKVGVYTSPFLERFNERMRVIDGREGLITLLTDETYGEISDDDLSRLSAVVQQASDKLVEGGMEHPTEFELVTAICYLWFKEQDIDVAVLETGLGGRLDSTNVIKNPYCTVITAMGLDHQDRLGDTIDKICYEKAGIIKPGCPCVISDPSEMILDEQSQEIVRRVFTEVAEEKGAQLYIATAGKSEPEYDKSGFMLFEIDGEAAKYRTRLLGDHQVNNAATAIKAARLLDGVTDEDVEFGIANAAWKGRAELLSTDPIVIMDGGHNFQGATSLAGVLNKMLDSSLKGKGLRVVMGVMKDKDTDGMLSAYRDGGIVMEDILTVRVNNARSMDPAELSQAIKLVYNSSVKVNAYEDANEAVLKAWRMSVEDGMPLLVTGSLYLIGEVRTNLKSLVDGKGCY